MSEILNEQLSALVDDELARNLVLRLRAPRVGEMFRQPQLKATLEKLVATEQAALASAILSPSFQIAFNKVKGSVPARASFSAAVGNEER